ncbi:TetR/AcrR family transcriptional regulator [Microbispora sp. ATCC PTA-5024]|uniref:TetR/AcrR family transcriptional regulator n=1 Tax=Microbispora sp. ATCC PTA-5024 TaxID=316330 RepID=UPI0003DC672D|nr:TetR/AcrR family transcriptional regulator [Microbispora sp. ATCC PTA-5024]ETK37862.1 hypothetical protein MPTA5024_01795 [Microbispora sp. ATCC PTA-5024]
MPKVVDHEARRSRLVDAVWALAVRDGLEGVSLRKVAAEAGVSMGQVQHYYPSMEELVRDALRRAVQAVDARIAQTIGAIGAATPEDVLRTCLRALIGLDAEGTRLLRFSLAVLGRTMSDPEMTRVLAPPDEHLLSFTADLIAAARAARGNAGDVERDDRMEADICWTLATALGVDVAVGQRSAEGAAAVLDHHLDRLLGG